MKKSLNISLVLLTFVFLNCSGCRSFDKFLGFEPEEKQSQGTNIPDNLFWDQFQQPAGSTPTMAAPPPTGGSVAIYTEPRLVPFSQTGPNVISKTYPWPECGIVQLDKTLPREVLLNKTFDYSITITNLTGTMLTDIKVIEELSENFNLISANPTPKEDINKLTWEISSLGPKSSKRFTLTGTPTHSDSLENCTTVVTPVIPTCAAIRIVQPRLELTKTAPAEALLCEPIPIVYMVTNAGTGAAQNVKIVERLPAWLRTDEGRNELVFDVGILPEGQSRQYTATLRAAKVGTYKSSAEANSSSGASTQSLETTTSIGLPELAIVNNSPERHYIGRPLRYEITVTNTSDIPAKNVVVENRLPNGATSIEASENAKFSGLKLIWELGTLAPGNSKKVNVSYTPEQAGTLTNSATATAYCADPVTDSVNTTITGISAILMEVIDVEDPVKVGDRTTYVISITNQGSAAATNINVSCILENNVQYVSSSGATSGSMDGRVVKFLPLSSLAPKSKASWRVIVAAIKPGDVRFKVITNGDQLTRPVEETESTHIYE
ncbi:MAG: hypothetical protein PVJ60_05520 [Phycisphaerales bacterium]|jgi:uncharacterized repeat protein (TIGR01451 family)